MGASRRLQRREAAPQSHVQPLARGDLQPVRHHDRLPAHRGYLYYISNPEEIDDDRLKKWMLDSFAVGNTIGEHLSIKDRIVVDEIPSGRYHLTTIMEAMKENRVVSVTYRQFSNPCGYTFPVEPYCLKLFENRWYLLGRNNRGEIRIYGLDRLEAVEPTDERFRLPEDFSADAFSLPAMVW